MFLERQIVTGQDIYDYLEKQDHFFEMKWNDYMLLCENGGAVRSEKSWEDFSNDYDDALIDDELRFKIDEFIELDMLEPYGKFKPCIFDNEFKVIKGELC